MNKLSMNHKIIYYLIPLIFTLFIIPSVFGVVPVVFDNADGDATINSPNVDVNNNGISLTVKSILMPTPEFERVVISFNVSSLGSNNVFESVLLGLYKWVGGGENIDWCVYELEDVFVESEVTWNNKSAVEVWTSAGGDFDVADGVCIVGVEGLDGVWMYWNITELFTRLYTDESKDIINLLIKNDEVAHLKNVFFFSDEYSNSTLHPRLLVNYSERVNLHVIFEEGIQSVVVNGAGVSNNSDTTMWENTNVLIDVSGGMKYYKWNDSNKHRHVNPFAKVIDQNYTLTVLFRPQVIPLNTVSPMWLMIALISCFTLAYSGAVFGKKIFT